MSIGRVAFGVGCFHFGYHPSVRERFKGSYYLSQVEDSLAKISNLEKIEIHANDEFMSHEFEVPESMDELCDGYNFFPFPQSDVHIHLIVYIPQRVQQELSARFFQSPVCERFIVDIKYPYYFPFTTIRAIDPPEDYEPSNAVFWCREFFRMCFRSIEDSVIRFECLGPSPFHADFFLEPHVGEPHQLFESVRTPSRDYDSFLFLYDTDYFDNIEDAYDSLTDHLDDQLGLFYRIVHSGIQRDREWAHFYHILQNIIENQKATGLRVFWRNTLRSEQPLHDAMIQLAQIEASDLDTRYKIGKELQDLHIGDKPPELLPFLEKEVAEASSIPFQQMKEILNLLDSRRTKRLEFIMRVLSAILGGATGAWLTLILKGLR